MTDRDWASFDEETERQVESWREYLHLWTLEVVSAKCAWDLFPTPGTREAYVIALSEQERCAAHLEALEDI